MAFHVLSRNTTTTFAGKVVRVMAVVATLSVVCASLMCTAITYAELTEDQKTNTRAFLNAFAAESANLRNWWANAGDDFCRWTYVTCSFYGTAAIYMGVDGNLANVDLSRLPELPEDVDGSQVIFGAIIIAIRDTPGLGTLPESWSRLLSLTQLYLNGNGITGTLPASWGSLTKLTVQLSLSNNKLTGTLSASWGSFSSLKLMFLSNNQFTGALPDSWCSLSSLEDLTLDISQLTGTLPDSWGSLSKLTSLSLTESQLTGSLPDSWGSFSSLKQLTLENNQLTGTLPAAWGTAPSLRFLFLSGDKLFGTLPAAWGTSPSLSQIYLDDNQLTGSIPEEWSQMPKLTWGDFSSNQLCGCLPSAWVGNYRFRVDAAVKAGDCATANACPVESSSSSSSHAPASSSSSKTSSHAAAECAVSHCITCETDNADNCARCAESYELTGNLQCAQKESNGAVRMSWNAGCQWVTFALMTLASSALFWF